MGWGSHSSVRVDLSKVFSFEEAGRKLLGPGDLPPRTGLAATSALG